MRSNCPRSAAAVIAFVMSSIPAFAQNEVPVLAGEVKGAPDLPLHGYIVALEDLGGHAELVRTDVEPDGAFRFRRVPCGDYILRLESYFGDVLHQEFVTVAGRNEPLVIQLPKQVDARPPSGGVAAARLQHPPAKKAFQAFVAAQKLSESGRFADAAKKLERAIEISPDYADAYSDLGAQYIRLGRIEDGISAIRHAIRIGGPNVVDLSNLACAQYTLRRFDDGLVSARAALQADPTNANAHYVLGLLLARDRRTLREAISNLAMAAESNRSARVALQQAQEALASETHP